jgi:hypothetical protein
VGWYGTRELSQPVVNDDNALLKLSSDVLKLSGGEPVTWAIDLNAGGVALMTALLTDHGQKVLYIPGRTAMGRRTRSMPSSLRSGSGAHAM